MWRWIYYGNRKTYSQFSPFRNNFVAYDRVDDKELFIPRSDFHFVYGNADLIVVDVLSYILQKKIGIAIMTYQECTTIVMEIIVSASGVIHLTEKYVQLGAISIPYYSETHR